MDIEFVAVQQLHITEATSFSDPCIPAERSSDDAYSRSIPETQNYKICSSALAGGTICQSMTATETSKHHYFDQDDTKYLVIANVSKKPNMKTLIYSAAAHGFSVVIVGLPNLDINDLHLAEGVIGTVENTSSSRENWRNTNSSNVVNINHNDSRANVSHVVETNDIMRVNKVMNENDDDVNKNNDSDDNDNSNNHSDINDIENNNRNNDKSNNINISSSNSSSSSSSDIIKKHSFCSILRFQTLQELKSFLIMREITLIGIEIMDEAVSVLSVPSPFKHRMAIMPGNEGSGLSVAQKSICDSFVYLPQYGKGGTGSLNVSVATTLVLHRYSIWKNSLK